MQSIANAKIEEKLENLEECGLCSGKGFTWDVHVWSDGPGQVQARCAPCDGIGLVEKGRELLQRLATAEQERAEAKAELAKLRTYCGLYFDAQEGKIPEATPDPERPGYILPYPGSGYVLATRPPRYPEYYEEHLRRAGNEAPKHEGTINEYLEGQVAESREARLQREALKAAYNARKED